MWIKDLQNFDFIEVFRCVKLSNFGKVISFELYYFLDVSINGYGQCSYFRVVNGMKVYCVLVIVKVRVVFLKVVIIFCLELIVVVLLVKVSLFLKRELNLLIDREYFWIDFKVVFGYINNEVCRFYVYVVNCVQIIRDVIEFYQWYYIEFVSNLVD